MVPLSAITPTLANMPDLTGRLDMIAGGGGLAPMNGSTFPVPDMNGPGLTERPAGITPGQKSDESFGNVFGRMVQEVSSKQQAAAETVRGLQSGDGVSLHQAVIAMEEANVSFQLMVEVRNKLLEAYQELMRMQV